VGDGHIAAAVPVQRLRIAGIGLDGVRLEETAQRRTLIKTQVLISPSSNISNGSDAS